MTLNVASGLKFEVQDKNDTLLDAVTSTGAGTAVEGLNTSKHLFQCTLSVSTTPTATIKIEGSMDGVSYTVLSSFTMSGSGDSQNISIDEDWPFIRGNCTAIAGSAATATLLMRS